MLGNVLHYHPNLIFVSQVGAYSSQIMNNSLDLKLFTTVLCNNVKYSIKSVAISHLYPSLLFVSKVRSYSCESTTIVLDYKKFTVVIYTKEVV